MTADKWFNEDVQIIYYIYQRFKTLTCVNTKKVNLDEQQEGKHFNIIYFYRLIKQLQMKTFHF